MKLLYVLHFYQPDFQFTHTLEHVYRESYKEIFETVKQSPHAKIVINITGSTIKIFQRWGVGKLSDDLRELYKTGRVEFTATAFAHALLHYTSPEQSRRQIQRDIDTLKECIGIDLCCNYLYSPEMFVSEKVIALAKEMNMKGLFISRNSLPTPLKNKNVFRHNDLILIRRNTNISRLCEGSGIYTYDDLKEALRQREFDQNRPMVIVHDAEIIGHHFFQKKEFFKQMMNSSDINWCSIDEFMTGEQIYRISKINQASWEQMPIHGKLIDPHWNNPKNAVHQAMWNLTNYVVKHVESLKGKSKQFDQLQDALDYIQYSCQYWWASSFPYWSAEIVVNTMWKWFKLNADIYRALKQAKNPDADQFIKKAQTLIFKVLQTLAKYEAKGWHTKNIAYYDNHIHPKKLKGLL